MLAACKLHDRNISHNQLATNYTNAPRSSPVVDRHVFFDNRGQLKIVDFSRATRHPCGGAVLTVPGAPNAWLAMADLLVDEDPNHPKETCKELTKLESLVGDKRTGKTAIAMGTSSYTLNTFYIPARAINLLTNYTNKLNNYINE